MLSFTVVALIGSPRGSLCCIAMQHFKQADIVMVTDGLCDISRDFLDKLQLKKEQLEFSVLGILIRRDKEELKQFSDRFCWVVTEDTVIQELFCSKLEYFRQSFCDNFPRFQNTFLGTSLKGFFIFQKLMP